MSCDAQTEQQIWELIYGVLSPEQSTDLLRRISSDPEVARAYSRIKLLSDVVADGIQFDGEFEPHQAEQAEQAEFKEVAPLARAAARRSLHSMVTEWSLALSTLLLVALTGTAWWLNQRSIPPLGKVVASRAGADAEAAAAWLELAVPATLSSGQTTPIMVSSRNETGGPREEGVELAVVDEQGGVLWNHFSRTDPQTGVIQDAISGAELVNNWQAVSRRQELGEFSIAADGAFRNALSPSLADSQKGSEEMNSGASNMHRSASSAAQLSRSDLPAAASTAPASTAMTPPAAAAPLPSNPPAHSTASSQRQVDRMPPSATEKRKAAASQLAEPRSGLPSMRSPDQADAPEPRDQAKQPSLVSGVQPSSSATASRAQAASSSRDAGSGGLESPQGNHDGQAPKAGAMGGAGLESVMAANGMRRKPSKLHVTARIPGGESLTVPTELQTVKELTLATLDRNEYQPGASLSFRTVTLSRSRLTPTPRQPIEVSVVTAERQPVPNLRMVVESIQGTANGQFQLPAELAEGRYWLVVKSPHASFPEWERAFVVSRSAQHNSSAKTTESLPDQPAAETQPNNNPQDRAQRESVQPDPAPQDSIPQGDTKRGAEQPAGEQLRRDAVTSDRTESTGTAATGTAPARGLVLPGADRGEPASPTPAILPSPSAPPAGRDVSSLLGPSRVTFYPEGGDLVAGVPNRVYFTVGDMDGRPVQASSELIDAEGRQVAEPAFLRPGLGSVSWTPQASKAYWLRFPGHPIAPQAFRVPACDPLATLTMRVTRSVVSADAPVELDLHSLRPAERLLVQVSCRGETVGLALVRAAAFRTLDPSQWAVPAASAATTHPPADSSDRAAFNLPVSHIPVFASPAIAPSVSLSGAFVAPGERLTSSSAAWKHARVRLPLGKNAYGVLRVTVSDFSSSFPRPLVERLVFRHSPHQLHIQLADPLGRHVAGTEMALRVQTRNEWSRPVATQLGLTIVGPVQQAETVAAKGLNDTNRPRRHRERLPGERREHGNQLASGNADPSANLEPETILARLPQHPSTVTDSERQAVTIDDNREGPSGGSPSKDDAETVGVGGRVEANGLNPWVGMTPWERDSPDRFFLGYEERWEIGRAATGFAEGRIQAVNLLSCLSGREWESMRVLDQSAPVLDAILATAGWRRFVADSDASTMNQATNRHASLPQRPVVLEPSLTLISTRSELLATQVAPPEQPTEEVQRVPNPQVESSNETRTQGRSTERGVRDGSAPVDTGAASNAIDAAPQPGGGSGPREPVTDLPRLVTHVAKSMHSLKQPGSADRGRGLAGPLPLHRWGPLLAVLSLVLLVFSRVARRRNGAPSQRWRTAARASLFITLVIGTFWSIRPWMTYIPPQTASQQVDGDLERAPTSPASSPLAQANPVPAASKPAASKPAASKPAASKPAVTKQIASAAVRSKPAAAAASGQAISSGDESSGVPLQANATGSDTIPSPRPGDHPAGVEGLLRDSFAKARKGVLEDIERAAVEDGSPLVESAVESPPESNSNQTVYYREFAVTEKWLVEHELDEQPARFSALTTLQSQANSPASAEPPPQLDQDTASTNEGENRSETQLWLPQLATTDRGETTIHWVLPQRPGQYLLRLDGHTQDGRIGSLLQRFEVIAPAGN